MQTSANEKVIYATRFSRKIFVRPLLIALALIALAVVCKWFKWEFSNIGLWLFLLLAMPFLLAPFIKYLASQFVITNQRIIIQHGFIARRSYEMLLGKVESIEVDQTLGDRLLWGSGTLIITGTGGTKESFPNVGGAIKFQEHLNDMLHVSST
jgi:membrane protein YdbS with pleckstrin-like domain